MKSANIQNRKHADSGQAGVAGKHLLTSDDAAFHQQESSNQDMTEPLKKLRNALRPSIQLQSFEDDASEDSED